MKALILHAAAGQGHQKIAEVIAKTFRDRGFGPENLRIEDSLNFTSPFFKATYPSIYFQAVKRIPAIWGWCYESLDRPGLYRLIKPLRSWSNSLHGKKLLQLAVDEDPDVIIMTHFFAPEILGRAKQAGKIRAQMVTVITDFYPHNVWVNDGTDFYWVMSEEGRMSLENRGVPAEKVIVGGIPVDRKFKPAGNRESLLRKFGMDPSLFTVLLTSGSFGLGPQEAILDELKAFQGRIQCLVVCGNNRIMEKKLSQKTYPFPVKIFGFVDFMADLMEASHLVIAKPGGSTATETLVKGLPMVVLDPIPGQESRNAQMLKDRNAAFFMRQPEQIKVIMKAVLDHPEVLEFKRQQIRELAKPHAADDLVSFVLTGNRP